MVQAYPAYTVNDAGMKLMGEICQPDREEAMAPQGAAAGKRHCRMRRSFTAAEM